MRDSPVVGLRVRLFYMIKKSILRQFRKSAGMTQAEMAELLRVPLLTLTKWEAGALDMKAKVLHGLLAARTKNRRRG
jgi:transcriptional regulator with XRE-family HTH domain